MEIAAKLFEREIVVTDNMTRASLLPIERFSADPSTLRVCPIQMISPPCMSERSGCPSTERAVRRPRPLSG